MAYSLERSQQTFIDTLESEFAQPSFEVSIPEPATVKRNPQGKVSPYITYQFGDVSDGFSETFAGATSNDFWLPFYAQAIASDAATARKIGNKLVQVFLGQSHDFGGQVRKRFGGSIFPIANADGTIVAYIFPISLGVKIQLFDNV